jgi:DNA-binding HxlR family transcriptional regulator
MKKEEEESITLTPEELEVSKFVLGDKRRVELIKKLMTSDAYFNQLAEKGSRSAIADTLDELVERGILTCRWEVKENVPEGNPAPFKAVKMFRIADEYRKIIEKLRL